MANIYFLKNVLQKTNHRAQKYTQKKIEITTPQIFLTIHENKKLKAFFCIFLISDFAKSKLPKGIIKYN